MDAKNEVTSEKEQIIKTYTLMGADKKFYQSKTPGTYGGNRKTKVYGTMDCPAALRAIAKYGYVKDRVFFADEKAALAAGFIPCASCQREKYLIWKKNKTFDSDRLNQRMTCTMMYTLFHPEKRAGFHPVQK